MRQEQEQFIEKMYKTCFRPLLARAMKRVGERDTAQDIVQDTFHTAVEKIDVLMAHEKPEAWLMAVLNNKILQYFARRKADLAVLVSIEAENLPEPGAPDRRLEAIHSGDELQKLGEVLTPEEFLFIKRLYIDKATHLELAKEYGITVYGSKKRRERIMEKLRRAYPMFREKPKKPGKKS